MQVAVADATRVLFGGLLEWVGDAPPTFDGIANAKLLQSGVMHLRSITGIGTGVLGVRSLELDHIAQPTLLSAMGGPGCMVLHGSQSVRAAEQSEWGKYPVLGFWGYDFIKQLAEQRLVATRARGA